MRRLRRLMMWLGGLTVFLAAFGYWQWHLWLERLQVSELQTDIASLGFSHVHFNHLQFRILRSEREFTLHLRAADIQWDWQGLKPQLSRVTLAGAQVRVDSGEAVDDSSSVALALPTDWQLPGFLPQELLIDHLQLDLPCASGRCELVARLRSLRVADSLNLQLVLVESPTPAALDFTYEVRAGLPVVELDVRAQELFELRSQTRLQQPGNLQWQGDLNARAYRPSPEWLAYLQAWNPRLNATWLAAFTQPLTATSEWQLALAPLLANYEAVTLAPAGEQELQTTESIAERLQSLSAQLEGELSLAVDLPSALPIPSLGDLSGKARVDLAIAAGAITRYELDIDSRLNAPILPAQLTEYDLALATIALKLQSAVTEGVDLLALPMQVQLTTEGNIAVDLDASVKVDTESFAFVVSDAKLTLTAESWSPLADLTLDGVKLTLESLTLKANPVDWQQAVLEFSGAMQVAKLRQSNVNPQAWSWRGKISAAEQKLQASGLLIAAGQLNLEHQLVLTPKHLTLDWQLGDVFLLAGKGLQELTPYWPTLLTLTRGRLGGKGRFVWRLPEPMPTGVMTWQLGDISGIYDTTAFKSISGAVELTLAEQGITIASDNLAAQEIVQGFVLGPARGAGRYNAKLDNIAAGQLTLEQLESEFLGGRLWLAPGQLDFTQAKQSVLLELKDIDLARLLAEHPAGDLVGSGRISGRIPIELSAAGVQVAQGTLSAAEPGGRLQYRSERAAALAASSPGMKLVTDALDDFHYTVLSSEVTYSDTGTLLLGVRLEGSSPAVEAGRPIHFNINLEEDLPALIYSLQLANQLSDVIKKRVQEKMQAQAESRSSSE